MYIAVCDDQPQALKQVKALIDEYALAHGVSLRVSCFDHADAMLKAAESERFTHYILDVMMPCMNGIAAAQEIRSFDKEAKLVFLTSFQEYAYQSYRVRAHNYLLKPICREELFALLDEFSALEMHEEASLVLHNGRSFLRVPFSKLSYLEVNQKKLYFQLTDGQLIEIPGTLAKYEEQLTARPEFVKPHRSYIVNLHHISSLGPEGCIMLSGKNLPVSRLLYQQVRKQYLMHLFDHAEV